MELHEKYCERNPLNKMICGYDCVFLREEKIEYELNSTDPEGYSATRIKKSFFCDKKKVPLYPVSCLRKKHDIKGYLEPDAIRMPSECVDFKSPLDFI